MLHKSITCVNVHNTQMFSPEEGLDEVTEPRKQPSVIKWEGGGNSVYVSFDNGQTKIPLVKRLVSNVSIFN